MAIAFLYMNRDCEKTIAEVQGLVETSCKPLAPATIAQWSFSNSKCIPHFNPGPIIICILNPKHVTKLNPITTLKPYTLEKTFLKMAKMELHLCVTDP